VPVIPVDSHPKDAESPAQMTVPFPARRWISLLALSVLGLTISFAFVGCRSTPKGVSTDLEPPPRGVTIGYDAIVVMPATADEGVEITQGALTHFTSMIRQYGGQQSMRRLLPPIMDSESPARGNRAQLLAKVTKLERSEYRSYGWIGRKHKAVTVSFSVRFMDETTGDPLCDWIDLSAHTGTASGPNELAALSGAGRMVASHLLRDQQSR